MKSGSMAEHWIFSWKPFLLISFLLTLLVHLPFLNRPPESQHVWRQCNTLAVARNFYEEDMNIFRPRVDQRFDSEGVTGMQFPSYEFGLATLYHLFSEKHWVHRSYSFFIYFLAGIGMYLLLLLMSGKKTLAAIGAWTLMWSPEWFYHGINALPDILALTFSIWGLYYFLKWYSLEEVDSELFPRTEKGKIPGLTYLLIALPLIVLAGLTKLQFLAIGFPIAVLVMRKWRELWKKNNIILLGIFGVVSTGIPLWWYRYSINLIEISGLKDFGIELRPETDFGNAISILSKNIYSDLPELLLNYAGIVLFVIGIFAFIKLKKHQNRWFLPMLAWTIGLIAYHIIELSQMDAHQYYMFPHLVILCMIAAVGGEWLLKQRKGAIFLGIILLAQPIVCATRILPARWLSERKQVPQELYQAESRKRLKEAVPNDALCIVGPDPSSCIYFYFLHKKGCGFGDNKKLSGKNAEGVSWIEQYIIQGATYLYSSNKEDISSPEVQRFLDKLILEEGKFQVWRLKRSFPLD